MPDLYEGDLVTTIEDDDRVPIWKKDADGPEDLDLTEWGIVKSYVLGGGTIGGVETEGADFTIAAKHRDKLVEVDAVQDVEITVPNHADEPLPVPTQLLVLNAGSFAVTFVGEEGVTIHIPVGYQAQVIAGGGARFVKLATNEWMVTGELVGPGDIGNIDGGGPDSNYGGDMPIIDGGEP